jgi:hypothetical protein
MIRTFHICKHEYLHQQYLEMVYIHLRLPAGHLLGKFQPFSLFNDQDGYAGFTPCANYFRQFYVKYIASHAAEMDQHMSMLSANVIQIDHSYKVSLVYHLLFIVNLYEQVIKHLGKVNGKTVFAGGLHTCVNEITEIRSMVLTPSKAHNHFMPVTDRFRGGSGNANYLVEDEEDFRGGLFVSNQGGL